MRLAKVLFYCASKSFLILHVPAQDVLDRMLNDVMDCKGEDRVTESL